VGPEVGFGGPFPRASLSTRGEGREWSGAERAARLLRLREGGSSNGAAMEQRGACAPGPLRRAVALQLAAVSVPGVAEGRLRVRAAGARGGR
jgi:hypothetical protein